MTRPNVGDRFPVGAVGDAALGDVLEGKTFSSEPEGVGATGTMPNRGAVNITPGTSSIAIPDGYHDGDGTVADLGGNAVAAEVLTGRTFSSNSAGRAVSGAMPNRTGNVNAQEISRSGTTLRFRPQAGYYPGVSGNNVQHTDANFVAGNIKSGVDLFGLVGSFSAASIKSTQTGSLQDPQDSTIITITISPVVVSNSIVIIAPDLGGTATISSSTTITIEKAYNDESSYYSDKEYNWQVIEFDSGVQIQRGSSTVGSTPRNITISSVNRAKSIVFISSRRGSSSYRAFKAGGILTLNDRLRVFGYTAHDNYNARINWQVLTFL